MTAAAYELLERVRRQKPVVHHLTNWVTIYGNNLIKFLLIISPAMGAMMVIGFVTSIAQVGFKVSTKALEPKFDKLNVIKGLTQLFAGRTLFASSRAQKRSANDADRLRKYVEGGGHLVLGTHYRLVGQRIQEFLDENQPGQAV